jgi:hypothetical protein
LRIEVVNNLAQGEAPDDNPDAGSSDVELLRASDGIVDLDAEAGGFSGISWRYWRERVAAKPT